MLHRFILACTFLLFSTTVFAHGSGLHVLGTVTAIDNDHVEVKTQKGTNVTVKLTKDTRFKQKGNPKSTDRPTVGDRVVVEATKDEKVLIATEVHFSVGKRLPSAEDAPAAGAPSAGHGH
ncbi:conserved exported protein of unknown function [Nitrospira sp. KM1]|uniref:DUF5666 domain-containing protein n=1 Tax=Nitrospira sp. KM1 TaxID=1936990 RepID=UPI0013A77C57|nr:DUF5666 domain-containing protein [Nitrospira sp. KM1]BCA55780.1 conserved exported protein of unknown function [Nitrospira sp. KM1]